MVFFLWQPVALDFWLGMAWSSVLFVILFFQKLTDPQQGYIKNDSVTVEVHLVADAPEGTWWSPLPVTALGEFPWLWLCLMTSPVPHWTSQQGGYHPPSSVFLLMKNLREHVFSKAQLSDVWLSEPYVLEYYFGNLVQGLQKMYIWTAYMRIIEPTEEEEVENKL